VASATTSAASALAVVSTLVIAAPLTTPSGAAIAGAMDSIGHDVAGLFVAEYSAEIVVQFLQIAAIEVDAWCAVRADVRFLGMKRQIGRPASIDFRIGSQGIGKHGTIHLAGID